jgi:hypothetical protein
MGFGFVGADRIPVVTTAPNWDETRRWDDLDLGGGGIGGGRFCSSLQMREAELVDGDQFVASRCSSLGKERRLVVKGKICDVSHERERVAD